MNYIIEKMDFDCYTHDNYFTVNSYHEEFVKNYESSRDVPFWDSVYPEIFRENSSLSEEKDDHLPTMEILLEDIQGDFIEENAAAAFVDSVWSPDPILQSEDSNSANESKPVIPTVALVMSSVFGNSQIAYVYNFENKPSDIAVTTPVISKIAPSVPGTVSSVPELLYNKKREQVCIHKRKRHQCRICKQENVGKCRHKKLRALCKECKTKK
jgi:hypothetical protein